MIQSPTYIERFPSVAIIVKGTYHSYTSLTAQVFVARNGLPFKSHDGKYLASQGDP